MSRTLVVVVALLGLTACNSIERVEVGAAYLQADVSGDVALGPSSGSVSLDGRRNDLEDDLGIDDEQPTLLLAARVDTPVGRFGASGFRFEDSGAATLGSDFGDIPLGTDVRSDFEFLNVKSYWVYDVATGDNYRVAPGLAVDVFDLQTSVHSTSGAQAFEEVEMLAPVPMLFLDGDARLGPVEFAAQGGGMRIDLGDGIGTYWDFEGRVGVQPATNVEIFAGYRYLSIDSSGVADSRDAKIDLAVQGWFVGGELRF